MQMRHFRYFIAAAEEGSFLKAAGRLRVAQPSLSRQIRDLERQVGVRLFERLPRGVRLTPAGDAFLREARQTMESAARALATARREGAAERMLKIGHGTLFYYAKTVTTLLAAFRAAYPDSHVTIRRMNETQQRAALRERRIDVSIDFCATITVSGFDTHHLIDAEIRGVVLAASHPLAQEEQISLADLRDSTWLRISHKTAPELYETAKVALLNRGLSPMRERPRPRDPAVAGMHVAAGDTWMLVSNEIGRMYTEGNPALVYRRFIEPPIPCWISMLSLPDPRTPNVDRLLDVAQQMATSPPAAGQTAAP